MVSKLFRIALLGWSATFVLSAGDEVQQKAGVAVVEVPVRVTDRQGKPVNDLAASDFTVKDNGQPQAIVSISLVGLSNSSQMTPSDGGASALISPPRTFILLFDRVLTQQFALVKAQQAALDFVQSGLRPEDSVAVIALTYSGYHVVAAPTRDRAVLEQAIYGRAAPLGVSEFSARPGGEKAFWDRQSGRADREAEFWSRDFSALAAAQAGHTVEIYLNALQALAIRLSALPGAKTILFFSEGTSIDNFVTPFALPTWAGGRVGAWDSDFLGSGWGCHGASCNASAEIGPARAAIFPSVPYDLVSRVSRTLSSAECRVYAIDPSGLIIGTRSRFGDNFILSEIASETGGEVFESRNDLPQCLRTAADQATAYYLLLYTPPPGNAGKYHKIRVDVHRPGVSVTHRKGYFEPRPFRKSSDLEKVVAVEAALSGAASANTNGRLVVQPLPRNRRDDSDAGSLVSIVLSSEVVEDLIGDTSASFDLFLVPIATRSRQGLAMLHYDVSIPQASRGSKWVHSESVKLPETADQVRAVLVNSDTGATLVAAADVPAGNVAR